MASLLHVSADAHQQTSKLLLKYVKINENACVGVAKFGTQT